MLKVLTPVRKTALLLFLSLSFCYMALAPGTVGGRGYVQEELDSGSRMLEIVNTWMKNRPVPPMLWSRHGPIPVLFDLPFIKIGKLFLSPDMALSLEPVLSTAALVTILFLWLRKVSSPRMSLLLSLAAAFGTMLWPYAYIGLETKQSLFVMLAAYLALAKGKIRGWPRLLIFAVVCGLAMTMKSTGIVLWPAFAYMVFVQFREDWRSRLPQLLVTGLVIAAVVAAGVQGRNFYWTPRGGGANNFIPWMIKSDFLYFNNLIGMFGSSTKGLFVFCPILIVSIFSFGRAFRQNRQIVIFAVLVTACMAGFLSLLMHPADEVWGPRFMHVTIAPLILCIGAAWPRFRWQHAPAVLLATYGVAISFLGAFFYYGIVDFAMKEAGQNTMEWINGDTIWNAIAFHGRVFRVWMDGGTAPAMWTPSHVWVWEAPDGAKPWTSIDLRPYSPPQALLVEFKGQPKDGIILTSFRLFEFSLFAGPVLMLWTIVRTAREKWLPKSSAPL